MLMPPISRYMTKQPWTVEPGAPLARAHAIMREHGVRHLPVLDEHRKIIGLVSQRDLYLLETFRDANPDDVLVSEAMSPEVYVVTSAADTADVVEYMAHHKLGAVVVTTAGAIDGIFTTTDAMQVLADVLRRAAA